MQEDILINWSPQETRVAVVENGAVQELHVERTVERGLVGNVYLGKVARVLPGMQSAFMDIGLERAAFLHVADVWHPPVDGETLSQARHAQPTIPIEKQVYEGQALMVQVIKDPIGSKGARLSTQISLAGRLLVFLPQDDHIGISQKIPLEQRESLRQRLHSLVGERGGGFILRTNGEDATDQELAEDMAYLRKTWTRIKDSAQRLSPQSLLHLDLNLLQRVLRDLVSEHTQTIRVDSREQFEQLRIFGMEFMPAAAAKLQHYQGETPIFDLFGVDEEIRKALSRRVELKSGGYLIVDQTEALTTIDVNTGGYVGARNFDDTIFKTNLEAAQSIARQLRLRNLGGIVIVDFIDMTREEHQEAVLTEFRKQLARDRVKTMVGSFSQLGLLEMTRKRTRESLAICCASPVPAVKARGLSKQPEAWRMTSCARSCARHANSTRASSAWWPPPR
jgi:ribonuclease G